MVKEYPRNSDFPVHFTVDHRNETEYTLEVFGKNGSDIDKKPYLMAEEREISDEKTNLVPLISGGLIFDMQCDIHECA